MTARPALVGAATAALLTVLVSAPALADRPLPSWQVWHADRAVRLGSSALLRDREEAADRFSTQAVRLAPDSPDAWRLRSAVLADQARWAEASEAARRLVALVPEDVDAALIDGRVRLELADGAGARGAYSRASDLDRSDPRGPIGRALVAARLERDFGAMEAALREARTREELLDLSALPLDEAWAPVADDPGFLAALQAVLTPTE